MFCSKCGQQVADNTCFCPSCGNSLSVAHDSVQEVKSAQDPMQQYQMQKNAVRQSEYRVLDHLISHFSQKAEQYDNYDSSTEAVNYYSRGAKKGLIVWGAILAAFGSVFLLAQFDSEAASLATVGLFVFLLPGLFMIFGGIMMQVANKKNYQKALAIWQQLSEELYNHYIAYPNCPVGPEYSNPHILVALRNTLQSGRADTIKECLNLMVADANQRAMEDYLAQIQRNAAQSARANTAAAIFLAASFFR